MGTDVLQLLGLPAGRHRLLQKRVLLRYPGMFKRLRRYLLLLWLLLLRPRMATTLLHQDHHRRQETRIQRYPNRRHPRRHRPEHVRPMIMIALQISTLLIIFYCSYTIRPLFSSSSVDQFDLLEDLGHVEAGCCREGGLPGEVPGWFAG